LSRFSEDIDFSLLKKNNDFDIKPYCKAIQSEMSAYGFDVEVSKKGKTDTSVESAFIKAGTLVHLLKIAAVRPPVSGVHENEMLKIRLEVDTDPPEGALYEIKYLLTPIPFSVRIFSSGSLFAGKLHALLCRSWNSGRIKGRDLYDYVWYLSRQVPVNALHLEQRMKQTGHLDLKAKITADVLSAMLEKKFKLIDYEQAKRDVLPFIKEPAELNLWSAEFFTDITREKLKIN
ncbi:MAG: nucleotidyl transferase AbiEii/AbiGii toxin family protein, partial [Desulfobacterales bacterium]|nr:nucleotidyl transferase AbiEii/AbiGii toxin family protein [Desulfobacterales bacterium]